MKDIHIIRAIYRKFKGFKTQNIEIADINMVRKLQQLISTNGSGKSTFLKELSLTPIDKEMFRKGGGKEIHFIVDGIKYIFISDHSKHVLLNGETLAPITQGETITHYNDTVKTLFGYDDYKWRLVTGRISFTKLTKLERQKWIETISGIDFSYPFKLYSSIRSNLTGLKRALKEYEVELSNGEATVLSESIREGMEGRKSDIFEIMQSIIAAKGSTPTAAQLQTNLDNFNKVNDELGKCKANTLNGEYKTFAHLNVSSLDEFRESYNKDARELDSLDETFKNKEKELREKSALRDRLSVEGAFNKPAAVIKVQRLKGELEELEDLTRGDKVDACEGDLLFLANERDNILQNINLEIMGKFSSTNDSIRHSLTPPERHAIKVNHNNSSSELRNLKSDLDHVTEMIESTKNGKTITCPKCNELFKDGEQSLGGLKIRSEELTTQIGLLTTKCNILEEKLNDINTIDNNINLIKTILNTHVTIHAIRHPLNEYLDGTGSISDITETLDFRLEMARNTYRILTTTREIEKINHVIVEHDNLAKLGSVDDFNNKCDALEQELIDIRDMRINMVAELKAKANEGKELSKAIDELDTLELLIEKQNTAYTVLMESMHDNALDGMLTELQEETGKLTHSITNDTIVRGIRSKLQTMIDTSKAKLKVLLDLESAINPSTGIIAEQLISYCNIFSAFATENLSRLWGYDMEVCPPIVHETKGVNYRFPMRVKDDELISDISRGSTSQLSIIDLAIVIASRRLLQADNQLLVLDEVGAGFDTIHNINLGEFMYELIRDSKSKNILVIHHDQSIRGMLGDCDVITFDPTQVVLDSGYNENVKLKMAR